MVLKHDFNDQTKEAWEWLWEFLTRSMTVVSGAPRPPFTPAPSPAPFHVL